MSLTQFSYAQSSQPSATPVSDAGLRRACAEAVEELRAARRVIEAIDRELKSAREVIRLEREISEGLRRLDSMSAAEIAELRKALEAKDRVIAAYEAEIAVLKRQRNGFWKQAKIAIVAAAAGVIVGAVIR
jgi:chromosome segregation ATPase